MIRQSNYTRGSYQCKWCGLRRGKVPEELHTFESASNLPVSKWVSWNSCCLQSDGIL